jgi:hypothetical protein
MITPYYTESAPILSDFRHVLLNRGWGLGVGGWTSGWPRKTWAWLVDSGSPITDYQSPIPNPLLLLQRDEVPLWYGLYPLTLNQEKCVLDFIVLRRPGATGVQQWGLDGSSGREV